MIRRYALLLAYLGLGFSSLEAQVRPSDPSSWIDQSKIQNLPKEGSAFLDLDVAADGRVSACRKRYATVRDSVWKAVCTQIMSSVIYQPAGSVDGAAIESHDAVNFGFKAEGLKVSVDFGGALPIASPAVWITDNDYPPLARRAAQEGDVTFAFEITPRGKVHDCTIQRSSGQAALDVATCELVTRRATFKSPLGLRGKPLATSGRGVFLWRLRKAN